MKMRRFFANIALFIIYLVVSIPLVFAVEVSYVGDDPNSEISSDSVVIEWETDVPTKGRGYYGDDRFTEKMAYDNDKYNTSHSVTLTDLLEDELYVYEVHYIEKGERLWHPIRAVSGNYFTFDTGITYSDEDLYDTIIVGDPEDKGKEYDPYLVDDLVIDGNILTDLISDGKENIEWTTSKPSNYTLRYGRTQSYMDGWYCIILRFHERAFCDLRCCGRK